MAHQTINKIFQINESEITASEAHGVATGMLCIKIESEAANWLTELFPENIVLLDEDKTILITLFEQTRKLLSEDDFSFRFDLFLPGDDEPLQYQLESLRSWCEGFLFGVGHNSSASDWSAETNEIMKDIVEFTKLDANVDDEIDIDEDEINENEAALIEIQEYLRAAVMLLRDQFIEEDNQQS